MGTARHNKVGTGDKARAFGEQMDCAGRCLCDAASTRHRIGALLQLGPVFTVGTFYRVPVGFDQARRQRLEGHTPTGVVPRDIGKQVHHRRLGHGVDRHFGGRHGFPNTANRKNSPKPRGSHRGQQGIQQLDVRRQIDAKLQINVGGGLQRQWLFDLDRRRQDKAVNGL